MGPESIHLQFLTAADKYEEPRPGGNTGWLISTSNNACIKHIYLGGIYC